MRNIRKAELRDGQKMVWRILKAVSILREWSGDREQGQACNEVRTVFYGAECSLAEGDK